MKLDDLIQRNPADDLHLEPAEDEPVYELLPAEDVEIDDRTRARGVALQILYEVDMSSHLLNQIVKERFDSVTLSDKQKVFIEKIVIGVRTHFPKMDIFLAKYAPEWPIDQIAVIDRNIVRIAIWEFAISGITPLRVAINESVELAKMFGSENSPRFVNGVLGSVAEHVEEIRSLIANQ